MTLEKQTALASVEILFPSRSVQVAWHTFISEGGVVISGPSIHRKAFPNEDIAEVLPEITDFVSADYLQLVSDSAQQGQLIAQLQAAVAEQQAHIAALQSLVAQRDARITALEAMPPSQQEGAA